MPTVKRQIGPLVVRAAATGVDPAASEAVELMRRFTSLAPTPPPGHVGGDMQMAEGLTEAAVRNRIG